VKKVLVTVPVRKPDKQWFIRVHPDPAYRLSTAILELKEERESYLVEPDMWPELTSEITPKTLFTAVNRQGLPFLLPVRLPGPDGRLDPWNQSLLEGVEIGMKKWVRIAPKMALGAYELSVATNNLPEPVWPDTTFRDLVAVAFKGRIIQTPDHPVLRRLRGEV